jgi:mRNA-degrading endonuclease RelE of RelBE toxin-antitoxin system
MSHDLDSTDRVNWVLASPKKDFVKFFKNHPTYTKYIPEFETDVTANPYRHDVPDRIVKLHPDDNYPKESYRWKKSNMRIVYNVSKQKKIILPLDADTAGNIKYRK